MKKFFVLTFIALFVAAASYAQENVFIINGDKVENFDGSQLTGKKIISFNVIKNEKGDIYNVHTDDILPDSLRNRPYKVWVYQRYQVWRHKFHKCVQARLGRSQRLRREREEWCAENLHQGKQGEHIICSRWQVGNVSGSERHCTIENLKYRCLEAWF